MPVSLLTIPVSARSPERLDECLREGLPRALGLPAFSNSKIRRLIVSGSVAVNGKRETRPAAGLRRGDSVTVAYDAERFAHERKPDDVACEIAERDVLYEDELLIAVNKPAGIPTEGTVVGSRDSLHGAVGRFLAARQGNGEAGRELPYVGLHHRLDRETSGVVLFTKKKEANAAVHALFADRAAKKTYLALAARQAVNPARRSKPGSVLGKAGDEVTVTDHLGRISPKSARAKWGAVGEAEGSPAQTAFTVIGAYPLALLVRCEPHTGRTHQIRVHLSGLGAPILGDTLYGGPETLTDGFPLPRVMLHAAELSFPHPADGRHIAIIAPEPADFSRCLAHCRDGAR